MLTFLQSGVSEVIYFVEKRINNSAHVYVASYKLLSMAGVKVHKTFLVWVVADVGMYQKA